MDSWGGSGISSKFAQRPQWLTTCPRRKENRKRMDVRLSKTDGGWVGIETEWEQTGFCCLVVTCGWKQNSGRQAISKRTFTSSRTTLCLRKLIGQRAEACRHIFKIVCSDEREKILKLMASPLFPGCMQFSNNLACERKVGNWTSPFMHGWRYLKIVKSWGMKTIRRKVRTHIQRYRQPFVRDSDWRCVHGYRRVDKMYLYDTSDYSKDHPL